MIKKFHTNFYIFLILYFTLILGFIFDESLNPGAYKDWAGAYSIPIVEFSKNFHDSFLNYEKYGNRHSPFYIMALSLLFKAGFNLDFIRLINLHICIFLVIVFYNCLRIRFEAIDKSTLQLLSLVIFLSPTFRSLAIWPDSRIVGLLFFVITIYYYLKFNKTNLNRHAFYSVIALIFSSLVVYWANNWGRNGWLWFVLALFISPLITAIILLIMGRDGTAKQEKEANDIEAEAQKAAAIEKRKAELLKDNENS